MERSAGLGRGVSELVGSGWTDGWRMINGRDGRCSVTAVVGVEESS